MDSFQEENFVQFEFDMHTNLNCSHSLHSPARTTGLHRPSNNHGQLAGGSFAILDVVGLPSIPENIEIRQSYQNTETRSNNKRQHNNNGKASDLHIR